jgi:hypothetical protein
MLSPCSTNTHQKRPRGRPSKLTKKVGNAIIKATSEGVYLETAAQLAGIAPRTLFNWMSRGKQEPESVYGRFFAAVKKALGHAEMRLVGLIEDHARRDRPGQWTAAAWILERRFPHHWSRRRFAPQQDSENVPEPRRPISEIVAEAKYLAQKIRERRDRLAASAGVVPADSREHAAANAIVGPGESAVGS